MTTETQAVPSGARPAASGKPARGPVRRPATGAGGAIKELLRKVIIAVFVMMLVVNGLGIWWSFQPPKYSVREYARELAGSELGAKVPGAMVTAAAIHNGRTLLKKPGGFTYNDKTPPGTLMDNMPNWEYGVLTEVRDTVRSLRNDFSRSQTQSVENVSLKNADSKINFQPDSWMLPAAEEQYSKAMDALEGYLQAMVDGSDNSARFFARADNLAAYLSVVEKRLGSYGQRLAASVANEELREAMIEKLGSAEAVDESVQLMDRTPWNKIDNIFFEARGYTWALLHTMKGLSRDFREVLELKNADVSMLQVVRDLEQATAFKVSPLVLNGHGYGMFANHSLVLASYLARANAAIIDLRVLMERG